MSGVDESDPWAVASDARQTYDSADDEVIRARNLVSALSDLGDAATRGKGVSAAFTAASDAFERFGGPGNNRRAAMAYLTEPVLDGEKDALTTVTGSVALSTEMSTIVDSLQTFVEGGEWKPVSDAFATAISPGDSGYDAAGRANIATLRTLATTAAEAAVRYRNEQTERLRTALASAYGTGDELERLGEQPIALLPVRLETRFVDASGDIEGTPEDLLVRVFPDQIHIDAHEPELTDEEVAWGRNFWALVWFARHPAPDAVDWDPDGTYLTGRLPDQRLRDLVADVDPSRFSDAHDDRYEELKERAWGQLTERFGRERAGYIVHALAPEDNAYAETLLSTPDMKMLSVSSNQARLVGTDDSPLFESYGSVASSEAGTGSADDASTTGYDSSTASRVDRSALSTDSLADHVDAESGIIDLSEQSARTRLDAEGIQIDGTSFSSDRGPDGSESGTGSSDSEDLEMPRVSLAPETVPALSFPDVARRPESWNKGARARMLPDRWVAVAVWTDETGQEQYTTATSQPVREPLAVGPSPAETEADDNETADAGTDERAAGALNGPAWLTDFDAAMDAGMGMRVDLDRLRNRGFDPVAGGFDRLVVVGVKGSMDADTTPEALADLLDAHHYTDGLAFLESGTPTNARRDDEDPPDGSDGPAASMPVEVAPSLVESGDRSDGDLLARALAIDSDADEHVFAHVEGADGTTQRDARHANSALWPATVGYYLTNLLVPNAFTDNASIWDGSSTGDSRHDELGALDGPLLWLDAYRRHFVRYVRANGPFPTLRVGRQPYGVLPAQATETAVEVSAVDRSILDALENGRIDVRDATEQGVNLAQLAKSDVSTTSLLESGASPDDLLSAGVEPRSLRKAGASIAGLSAAGADPGAVVRDLVRDERERRAERALSAVDADGDAISTAGITPTGLAEGTVSPEQLQSADISETDLLDAALPQAAKDAGVTAETLADSGVTPTKLLAGEVSAEELANTPVDETALYEAVLPAALRDAGVTPDRLSDAGITPASLLSGDVQATDLATAGITPETLADAGLLPGALGDAVGAFGDLVSAGLDPVALAKAGADPQKLAAAGLTPDVLATADVLPDALAQAGLSPMALVDAGMDIVAVAKTAGLSAAQLADAGASAAQLARAGASVAELAGVDVPVDELLQAGYAVEELLGVGADATTLLNGGAAPSALREAGVDPTILRQAGRAAGALRKAGFDAGDLLSAGYSPQELTNGGFDTRELSAAGVDRAAVEDVSIADLSAAGKTARQLHDEGFGPDAMLDSGYDAAALLGSGYTVGELRDANVPADRLLGAGASPRALRASGVAVDTLVEAGVDPATLRDTGADAKRLADAGIDKERLVDAGFSVVELEVAGVDVDDLAEEAASGDLDTDDLLGAAMSGLSYAVDVVEDPEQAQTDLYSFSFDPAVERATTTASEMTSGRVDPIEGTADLADTAADVYTGEDDEGGGTAERGDDLGSPNETSDDDPTADGGVAEGVVPLRKPQQIDDRVDTNLRTHLSAFRTLFAEAATDLPGADGVRDGAALVNLLHREGVSHSLEQQLTVQSGERSVDDPAAEPRDKVARMGVEGNMDDFRETLETYGLDSLDPRLAYLFGFNFGSAMEPLRTIERHDLVDSDLDRFLDILTSERPDSLWRLSSVIDPDGLPLDPAAMDLSTAKWNGMDTVEQRRRLVRGIEEADDAWDFYNDVLKNTKKNYEMNGPSERKLRALVEFQAEYDDSGVLRSLARILLYYGTLHGYLGGRLRLGAAYGDPPNVGPDPGSYEPGDPTPFEELLARPPDSLAVHPDVDMDLSGQSTEYSYADALYAAAMDYDSTTSIDPRISELGDSLSYLRGVDPADVADLLLETADLSSHRLDAWWTSLATKRLFELREAQSGLDDGGPTHESWVDGSDDAPRATMDPSLLWVTDTDGNSGDETAGENTDTNTGAVGDGTVDIDEESAGGSTDGLLDSGTGTSASWNTSANWQGDVNFGGEDGADERDEETGVDLSNTTESEKADSGPTTADVDSVAERSGIDSKKIDTDRLQPDPGLYVGGYGFVEDLSAADGEDDTAGYIHAPSESHARTAAILRSGYCSFADEDGTNPLAVDLSAEQVREGLRLIRGVRRGEPLGNLLGYRFERRLHEVTMRQTAETLPEAVDADSVTSDVNLLQYRDAFRSAFPTVVDRLERPDESQDEAKAEEKADLARRDVVDGYDLLREWDRYPFDIEELPVTDNDEYTLLDGLIEELTAATDAVSDLLVAESIHQLGEGNFTRAGSSLDTLAKGEQVSDPQVIETPRTTTGTTHRLLVLLDASANGSTTARGQAQPVVDDWVGTLLPALDTVGCGVTYEWESNDIDGDPTTQTTTTTLRVSALELGPLDVLSLVAGDERPAESELEQRFAYEAIRGRPADTVPEDATVRLEFRDAGQAAIPVADLLELARTVSDLVGDGRPATATDLGHPGEATSDGVDDTTAAELESRAKTAQDDLYDLAAAVDERMAALVPAHAAGDGLANVPDPRNAADGGTSQSGSDDQPATPMLPRAGNSPSAASETPSITERVSTLVDAAETFDGALPLDSIATEAAAIDGTKLRAELQRLGAALPAGPASSAAVEEELVIEAATSQEIVGKLGRVVEAPVSEAEIGYFPSGLDPSSITQDSVAALDGIDTELGGGSDGDDGTANDDESGTANTETDSDDGSPSQSGAESIRPLVGIDPADLPQVDQFDSVPGLTLEQLAALAPDYADTDTDVVVWATAGDDWFEHRETVTADETGRFSVDFDASGLDPGTPFHVAAVVDGDVVYSATGRVMADGATGTDPTDVLANCPNLRRLLWLRRHRKRLDPGATPNADHPGAVLADAGGATDWPTVTAEIGAATTQGTALTTDDQTALAALGACETLDADLGDLGTALTAAVDPIDRLGLPGLLDVTGDRTDPTTATYWSARPGDAWQRRSRVRRVARQPAPYVDGFNDALLAYQPTAAEVIARVSNPEGAAEAINRLVSGPSWLVATLDSAIDSPHELLRDLTAWLYGGKSVPDANTLAMRLGDLKSALSDLPSLDALLSDLGDDPRGELRTHLEELATALGSGSPQIPAASSTQSTFDSARNSDAGTLDTAATTVRDRVDGLTNAPISPANAFRLAALERLRQPLSDIAAYGVVGATPRSPTGGTPDDEAALVEQADGVLVRVRERLTGAVSRDPRATGTTGGDRVERATERLRALFGESFPVLPSFAPGAETEIARSFRTDILGADTLAPSSWLERAAAVRERPAVLQDTYAAAEALTGGFLRDLQVAQVPHEPAATWIGVDGETPEGGEISTVAQFGGGADLTVLGGRVAGVFVDEWVESTPTDRERTGIALNYDDPGARAPQSVLLASPPADGEWSLDELVSTVIETAEYARLRAVDETDIEFDIQRLLPGINLAKNQTGSGRPKTPSVDLDMLDWYDPKLVAQIVPATTYTTMQLMELSDETGDGADENDGGDDQ